MRDIADQYTSIIAFELIAELLINGVDIQRGRKAAEAIEDGAEQSRGKWQISGVASCGKSRKAPPA
jgi:hypothetical protein